MKIKTAKSNVLYLTELSERPQIKKKKKNNKFSSYLVKNQKKFNKAKIDVIDYMLNDQINHTDFYKISEFYQNKLIEDQNILNDNENEIKKKRELLEVLELQISEVMIL